MIRRVFALGVFTTLLVIGCSDDPCDGPAARSHCSERSQDDAYYVDQALRYFDTYDADLAPTAEHPTYAEHVARWEWPPWLKLTGYGADLIEQVDAIVLEVTPSRVPVRDCRAFDEAPFARCRVSFRYEGGDCPIYEEFTFNDAGEITFIEAWSNQPGLLPMDPDTDPWAEGEGVTRLSTRVPGLGTPTGYVDPMGDVLTRAAEDDPDLADLQMRMNAQFTYWLREYQMLEGGTEAEIYGPGCGW